MTLCCGEKCLDSFEELVSLHFVADRGRALMVMLIKLSIYLNIHIFAFLYLVVLKFLSIKITKTVVTNTV